jgi:hypothetical protein
MAKLFFVFFVTIITFKMLRYNFLGKAEVLEKNRKPRCPDSPRDGANRDTCRFSVEKSKIHIFFYFKTGS